MENKHYNLKVEEGLWKKFKSFLKKDITMNQAIISLIEKFIKENEK